MVAIVVGLGSMGKRRIRLMRQLDPEIQIIGVDNRCDRRVELEKAYHILCVPCLEQALAKECDIAFICTAPLAHANLISQCLRRKLHVFTEINLVDDLYEENMKLAAENNCVLFLSSTFLYREEIRFIMQKVRQSDSLLSYTYHVGQYLPDWHPWEDYMQYFVGDDRTNGCREIMAIDFPWLYKTFGRIVSCSVKKNKKTKLKTTYDDSYLLLVEHDSGIQGTIMIDVVSRKAVRNLEIYGEDLYITWDGTANGLKQYNLELKTDEQIALYGTIEQRNDYAAFVVENAYRNEIQSFFEQIKYNNNAEYGFEDDKYILRFIDWIEEQ